MGLLTDLLLFPIVAPTKGLRFILEQIKDQADTEMLDERPVREALVALSLRLDLGEISEEAYEGEEAALFARLNEIHTYQEEVARGDGEASDDAVLEDTP